MKKLFHGKNLPIEKLDSDFETDINLSSVEKGQLRYLKKGLFQFVIQETQNVTKLGNLLVELDQIKDRILNPASHSSSISYYSSEINDAIDKVKELRILIP